MRAIVVLLFVLLAGEARAGDWGNTDTAMLAGVLTLSVIDWGQTRDLARRQQRSCFTASIEGQPGSTSTACTSSPVYKEDGMNPFLPAHPTTAQVDKSFALGMLATAGIAYVLPQTYRRWFLGGVIVIEAGTVIHNHQIGLRVDF